MADLLSTPPRSSPLLAASQDISRGPDPRHRCSIDVGADMHEKELDPEIQR